MDERAKFIVSLGEKLFSDKAPLDQLNQQLAEHFAPHRADFTSTRSEGADYASNLFTSVPLLCTRELVGLLSTMLRPRMSRWISVHVGDETADSDQTNRAYLEGMSDILWRGMYDPDANMVAATKEADWDFVAFGQAVLQVSPNTTRNGLLYTTHHIRDCVWLNNLSGKVDFLYRRWKPTARELVTMFGDKVSPAVRQIYEADPSTKIACAHAVVSQRLYDMKAKNGKRPPFVSLYLERETNTVLEETPQQWFGYVVPRWVTVPESQYGRSLVTNFMLPDSRTMQTITRTVLEAGEKFVDPPLLARSQAIRGDVAMYAGGITDIDLEYDENLGEVLRPIVQDKSGVPIGQELLNDFEMRMRSGFMLDKLQLPPVDMSGSMTATEVRKRIEDSIRAQAPLLEPAEDVYSIPMAETSFEIMQWMGGFGPKSMIPEGLSGQEIKFTLQSPLRDVADQAKAAMFADGLALLGRVAEIDPTILALADLEQASADSLRGLGWPATWMNGDGAVKAARAAQDKQKQMAMGVDMLGNAANIGKTAGDAAKAFKEAGIQ